jgi:hypothetical protein
MRKLSYLVRLIFTEACRGGEAEAEAAGRAQPDYRVEPKGDGIGDDKQGELNC